MSNLMNLLQKATRVEDVYGASSEDSIFIAPKCIRGRVTQRDYDAGGQIYAQLGVPFDSPEVTLIVVSFRSIVVKN